MIPSWIGRIKGKTGGGMGSNLGLTALGITMGLCVGIGTGAGYLLDRRLGSTPTFMVVGFLWAPSRRSGRSSGRRRRADGRKRRRPQAVQATSARR